MAPKRALQNILGHKKWGYFRNYSPTCKSGGLCPKPLCCSVVFALKWCVGIRLKVQRCADTIVKLTKKRSAAMFQLLPLRSAKLTVSRNRTRTRFRNVWQSPGPLQLNNLLVPRPCRLNCNRKKRCVGGTDSAPYLAVCYLACSRGFVPVSLRDCDVPRRGPWVYIVPTTAYNSLAEGHMIK